MPESLAVREPEQQERWDELDIRITAIMLVSKLPPHPDDAIAVLDQARIIATEYLYKGLEAK